MTDRISHEEALSLAEALPGHYHTRTALLHYIRQQLSLEADTVSRAEHEETVKQLEANVLDLGERLTALQAELEQAKSTANAAAASLAKEIEAKCTERDRAEEAERHKAHDADIIAQLYAEHADLASQLAAANARVGRLERFVCDVGIDAPEEWKVRAQALLESLRFSTAPQASTEQASPSPAVGEEPYEPHPDQVADRGAEHYGVREWPAQPAPGGTELPPRAPRPVVIIGGSLPDDPLTDEMKALGEGGPEQAGDNPHTGSQLSSAYTAHEWAEVVADARVEAFRAELVEALQHVHQRTRNAAGETNMTGLLFKLAADRLESK